MEGKALRPSGSAWLANPINTTASEDASLRSRGIGAMVSAQLIASILIAHHPGPARAAGRAGRSQQAPHDPGQPATQAGEGPMASAGRGRLAVTADTTTQHDRA